MSGYRDLTACRDWSCISPPPGWTPSLGLLSSADDGLTVMRYVHYADSLVLSPVHLIEVVSTHDLAQLPIWRWGVAL